jgi:hypothetical protein
MMMKIDYFLLTCIFINLILNAKSLFIFNLAEQSKWKVNKKTEKKMK